MLFSCGILINCKEHRPVIQAISGGSAKSMSNISKKRLEKTIICPPREPQDALAPFINQIDESKSAVQQRLDKLETLKSVLMQEYFR